MMEAEVRAILHDWTDLTVQDLAQFWLIAGNDPNGVRRSGCNADVIDLATRLAEQGRYVEPEPEPIIVPEPEPVSAVPASVTPTPDAAPDEAAPEAATEGGSLFDDLLEPASGGAGIMVNNTGGVMAADRTEELRAKKIGETVIEHRRLVDASFTVDEAHTLQQLRSRSNAAVDGTGNPLTDDEQTTLDRLAVEETWAARMDAELQRRLAMLNEADAEYLQTYSPRGGWE